MIQVLSNSYQRANGAMWQFRGLGQNVLMFAYPAASPRIYTTWFCPPLRILCFSDLGELLLNKVVTSWQLVALPKTRLVIELDPQYPYLDIVREIANIGTVQWMARIAPNAKLLTQNCGGSRTHDPLGRLLFGMVRDAIADLSKVKDLMQGDPSQKTGQALSSLPAWRRGQILCSAGFILDVSSVLPYQVPREAVKLSRTLVRLETDETQKELLAAAIAGGPWNIYAACFRCSSGGTWRRILKPSGKLPGLIQWRLDRPENHIPLCNLCENTLDLQNINLAMALGYCYWGYRFEALNKWFSQAKQNQLPSTCWNLDDYPLWPKDFGGATWARGSGAVQHCLPHLGKVLRGPQHVDLLRRVMREGEFRPGRMQRGQLYSLLHRSY
jgi:hypothetical protein